MAKRIDWIDVSKGIGIFLVVLGHCTLPNTLNTYIYSFHMPLFFFLSGLVFNSQKFSSLIDFLKKQFSEILFPYALFYVIHVSWYGFYSSITHTPFTWKTYLIGLFVQQRESGYPEFWFLSALFLGRLIIYLLDRFVKNKYINIMILCIVTVIGFLYAINIGTMLPWSFNLALVITIFVRMGMLAKKYLQSVPNAVVCVICSVFLVVSTLFVAFFNEYISGETVGITFNRFGFIPLFFVTSFLGIASVFYFSNIPLIKSSKVLKFLGKNSLSIYCLHFLIKMFVEKGISLIFVPSTSFETGIIAILISTITILLCIPFAVMYNKWVIPLLKRIS